MDERSSRIVDVLAWEGLDSRGHPTVACEVRLADGSRGLGIAPAGASTGTHEAREVRDGGDRLAGRGVQAAVDNVVRRVAPRLSGVPGLRQGLVDRILREIDGPPPGGEVGANATIAVSIAVWLAASRHRGVEPFESISARLDRPPLLPMPMVNILSGGLHARGSMDVQDILVVPVGATSISQALEWTGEVRRCASDLVEQRGGPFQLVADEGGLALPGASTTRGLELVEQAVVDAGFDPREQVALALDVAATTLWSRDDQRYDLVVEGRSVTRDDWIEEITGWCGDFPLVSIEDPVTDTDWEAWRCVARRLGDRVQLVGDDLFVTDSERVRRGHRERVANAVLVKPNQTGTLSEAQDVIETARACQMATVVSARSGETEQAWLADLAVGAAGRQIKVGSLTRAERTAKWNRLLHLEATYGLPFAGAAAITRGRPTEGGAGG